jgi:hypothetical protein
MKFRFFVLQLNMTSRESFIDLNETTITMDLLTLDFKLV